MEFLRNLLRIAIRPDLVDAVLHGPTPRRTNVGKDWGKSALALSEGKPSNWDHESSLVMPGNILTTMFQQTVFSVAVLLSVILGTNDNGRVLFFGKNMEFFSTTPPIQEDNFLFGNSLSAVGGIVYPLTPTVFNRGDEIRGLATATHSIRATWQFYVPSLSN